MISLSPVSNLFPGFFMRFYNGLDQEVNQARSSTLGVVVFDPEEDLAKQDGKDDADINTIIKRYYSQGLVPKPGKTPYFADVSEGFDYQTALNSVRAVQYSFGALPAEIREEFGHDAGRLARWLENPNNAHRAAELGLLNPEATERILRPPAPVDTTPAGGSSSAATG